MSLDNLQFDLDPARENVRLTLPSEGMHLTATDLDHLLNALSNLRVRMSQPQPDMPPAEGWAFHRLDAFYAPVGSGDPRKDGFTLYVRGAGLGWGVMQASAQDVESLGNFLNRGLQASETPSADLALKVQLLEAEINAVRMTGWAALANSPDAIAYLEHAAPNAKASLAPLALSEWQKNYAVEQLQGALRTAKAERTIWQRTQQSLWLASIKRLVQRYWKDALGVMGLFSGLWLGWSWLSGLG